MCNELKIRRFFVLIVNSLYLQQKVAKKGCISAKNELSAFERMEVIKHN